MRLIDADKYKREIMDIMACWNISPCLSFDEQRKSVGNLKTALNVLDEMPTAFDLKDVIKKINNLIEPTEQYSHGFCATVTDKHCAKYTECEFCLTEQIIKILKSATNTTKKGSD